MQIEGTLPDTWGEEYKDSLKRAGFIYPRGTLSFPVLTPPQPSSYYPSRLSVRPLVEDGYTDAQVKKIRAAVDWCLDDIRRRHRKDIASQDFSRSAFLDELRSTLSSHKAPRVLLIAGDKREPVFTDLMRICAAHGYKGDTSYEG